jgi:hypothetical protein
VKGLPLVPKAEPMYDSLNVSPSLSSIEFPDWFPPTIESALASELNGPAAPGEAAQVSANPFPLYVHVLSM